MPLGTLRRVFRHEAASGIVLMLASALALALANSPFAGFYDLLLNVHGAVRIDGFGIDKPVLLWINDGLMAVFFLLIGLEVKREVLAGELADRRRAILPVAAAIGGMIVPALIYLAATRNEPGALAGWAIPCETDIAFSLGVMALFGARVAPSLKLFLTALAIIDDLGAIIIIALFYTDELSRTSLGVALSALVILLALNLAGVQRVAWYVLVGIVLWVFVLKSGVHATLAGVALALAIPFKSRPGEASPLLRIEHELAPWVGFGIVPLFGFANAGLSFTDLSLSSHCRADPSRHCRGPVSGQTGRRLRRGGAADPPRLGASSGRRQLGRPLRHQRLDRHRLHDEPLHRHARLWPIRPRNGYAVGRACRLGAVGGRWRRGARFCGTSEYFTRPTA